MIGALLLGFVAGIVARVLMPGDVFRKMSGPASWGLSLVLGLAGALLGYVIFTLGLGIGDTDVFDWGGLLSAIIGTLIVLGLASYFLRRRAARSEPAPAQDPVQPQAPAQPFTQAPTQPPVPQLNLPPRFLRNPKPRSNPLSNHNPGHPTGRRRHPPGDSLEAFWSSLIAQARSGRSTSAQLSSSTLATALSRTAGATTPPPSEAELPLDAAGNDLVAEYLVDLDHVRVGCRVPGVQFAQLRLLVG